VRAREKEMVLKHPKDKLQGSPTTDLNDAQLDDTSKSQVKDKLKTRPSLIDKLTD